MSGSSSLNDFTLLKILNKRIQIDSLKEERNQNADPSFFFQILTVCNSTLKYFGKCKKCNRLKIGHRRTVHNRADYEIFS